MRIRIVLVEPKWDLNVGSVCRLIRNFRAQELWLVNPIAPLGPEAVMFAKHAKGVLKKARKVKTLGEATRGCTVVVGTTGVVRRFGQRILKKCISARELHSKLSKKDVVALVFGNEEHGLSDKTLGECDFVAFIPSNPRYPVLNLSHAVGVMLYELCAARPVSEEGLYRPASRERLAQLEKMFFELASKNPAVRNPKQVALAFKRVLRRARPSENEVQALFAAF